jgi:predicted DsbA family dithiol-disulfide isomerase
VTVALVTDKNPVAPRILGGRWELLEPLASGGMGVLYIGRHLQTGRRAAIKVIDRAEPDTMARFKLEASISAQLNHPGIVDVFDADTDVVTGSCFIAMELLVGQTLRGVMDDAAATPHQVLGYLVSALEPLVVAHEQGFVHRDLKPENIFVTSGQTPSVKLLDFGIVSQQTDNRLTRVGTAMGTPYYMSPEQATSARDAGPQSDVWSMGVMIYEAISGELPFRGETSNSVIIQACTCPHTPLDAVATGVDGAIARLVDRCLAKAPAERPANGRELLRELRDMLRPNSLPAARPSLRAAQPLVTNGAGAGSGVRPSIRTRSITSAAQILAASGVVAGLSAVALPLAGLAAPGAALLCAVVGGGLLYGASIRMRSLQLLAKSPSVANHNARNTEGEHKRPAMIVEYPVRGSDRATIKLEMFADLSCTITRRACQRVMALRAEHPEALLVVYRPWWDPEREHARQIAEAARALFERDGAEVFWEFFDRIINSTRKINSDLVMQLAAESGADMHGLGRALRSNVHRRSVQMCREEAETQGVTESPTVYINGSLLRGDVTVDRLHWAYVDAKSALDRRRVVEMDATRAGVSQPAEPRLVRAFLVRYRGARNAPPALRRTKDQAYERACKLVARAKVPGSDFADIALRFADTLLESSDMSARRNEPPFADVIRKLQIDQLSEPIETDEGYQVLQRVH